MSSFLVLQQEAAAQLGLDQTNSSQATLLKRWLNTAQQLIFQAADWPFLRGSNPLIVQTVADYTTGTVTVAAGSASATTSATIAASKAGQYIQFASSKDWYKITAHTAGTAALTIDPAAISANTAATYTIRNFYNTTSSAVDRIIQMRQSITPYQLIEMTKEQFDRLQPDPQATGTPRLYVMAGQDSSNYPQFLLWPTPDAVINLYIDYLKTATDMSADANVSIIPAKWHTSVLLIGALWQGYMFLDDTREDGAKADFFSGIEMMKRQMAESLHLHRVLQTVEMQPMTLPFQLPPTYPMGS